MLRKMLAVLAFFWLVGIVAAAEIKGTVKSVDPAKSTLTITVDKADQTIAVSRSAMIIYGNTGKAVKGGLKGLTDKMQVEVTVEDGEAGDVITLIKVNMAKK